MEKDAIKRLVKYTIAGCVTVSLTLLFSLWYKTDKNTQEHYRNLAKPAGLYCVPVNNKSGVLKCQDGIEYNVINENENILLSPVRSSEEINERDRKDLNDFVDSSEDGWEEWKRGKK